jgi:hypothetical protein
MWGRRSVRCNFMIHNGNHQRVEGEQCVINQPLHWTSRGKETVTLNLPTFSLLLFLLFLFYFCLFKRGLWKKKKTWNNSSIFFVVETEIGFRRYPVQLHWTSESSNRATSFDLSICSTNSCSNLVRISFSILFFFSSLNWSSTHCNSIPPFKIFSFQSTRKKNVTMLWDTACSKKKQYVKICTSRDNSKQH